MKRIVRRALLLFLLISAFQPMMAQDISPSTGRRVPLRISSNRQLLNPTLGIYQFFGEVTAEFEETLVRADELTYTEQTRTVVARGNVSIRLEDGNTYWGNALEYNVGVAPPQWRFVDVTVEFPPAYIGAPVIAPVYVNSQELSGLPSGLRATNAHVTTCDLVRPHYEVVSRRVDIYPGDKLIARDNDFYVLGRRILHVPYFFLSLQQRRTPIVPEVGRNDFEGYYSRFLYQYVLSPNQLGGIRLDLTEKRGIGLGVDHFYAVPQGNGEFFAYARKGISEYVTRVDHTQQLPGQIGATVRADIRQNSQFTQQPTTITYVNSQLARRTTHTNATLGFTRQLNEGPFNSDNITSNLQYTSTVAAGTLNTTFNYSSFAQGLTTTTSNRQLWSHLDWTRPMEFADFSLRIDKRDQLDGSTLFSSGVQRLPELVLTRGQQHQQGTPGDAPITPNDAWYRRIGSTYTLSWGKFNEVQTPVTRELDRYRFEWNATTQNLLPQRSATTLTGSAAFRQTMYGDQDNTAQYTYDTNLTARTRLGHLINTSTYRRQESRGFTPFLFDIVYPYNSIVDSIQYETPGTATNPSPFRATLTSGRDLENKRWQDIALVTTTRFGSHFGMNQSVSYDVNSGAWRDLVSQYSWRPGQLVTFNLGSRYDLETSTLRRVSTELDWVISPVWRLQWLGGYDGVTKDFSYNEFLLTRDLHCWDASLYASQQQKYVGLFVRLKALNIPLPRFGIGNGGQVLNTDQGAIE